jgi:hypothetical protein
MSSGCRRFVDCWFELQSFSDPPNVPTGERVTHEVFSGSVFSKVDVLNKISTTVATFFTQNAKSGRRSYRSLLVFVNWFSPFEKRGHALFHIV